MQKNSLSFEIRLFPSNLVHRSLSPGDVIGGDTLVEGEGGASPT